MSTQAARTALSLVLLGALALACTGGGTGTPEPPATPTSSQSSSPSPTASATGVATGTAVTTPNAGAPPANVRLEGRLPDLTTPVPPGEGEAGRVTVRWEGGAGAQGFRIYVKDCDGSVRTPIEVAATDHQFGPLQACRPTGNIGVAAAYARGESPIVWVR